MILVTGGAGFIGSHFVKRAYPILKQDMLVVDKLTYASCFEHISNEPIEFCKRDIADKRDMDYVFRTFGKKISMVVNFAAESHVDRSISNVDPFILSNVMGTVNLLNYARKFKINKFIQISTDEVFGQVYDSPFTERSPINPRNPYAASKAAAEMFVMSYQNTHRYPSIIINSSNNFGPYQYPEKLIPVAISKLLRDKPVPVYGSGMQIRDWIFVEDNVDAIIKIIQDGVDGERYCVGGENELENITVVKKIAKYLDKDENLIEYVNDRPGHDLKYSTRIDKMKDLGWSPKSNFDSALEKTIEWYKERFFGKK